MTARGRFRVAPVTRYDHRRLTMPKLDTHADIDWTACELIEQIPGKVSGRPLVRGTRIMPDGIVNSYAWVQASRISMRIGLHSLLRRSND